MRIFPPASTVVVWPLRARVSEGPRENAFVPGSKSSVDFREPSRLCPPMMRMRPSTSLVAVLITRELLNFAESEKVRVADHKARSLHLPAVVLAADDQDSSVDSLVAV